MRRPRPTRLLSAVAAAGVLLAGLTGCLAPPQPTVVDGFFSGVSVPGDAGAAVDLVGAQLDAGAAAGPVLTVSEAATVVNGGSIQQAVSSSEPFDVLRIAVEAPAEDSDAEPSGAPGFGYFEVTLSEPTTAAVFVLTVPQALPADTFVTHFAAVDPGGAQGTPATQSVDAISVGTGDVQVTVSWNVDSDLDLHIVEPGGTEIYWEAPVSPTGGQLDLDSNAGCEIDGVRNENITWATGDAAVGEYTVLVDLWDACGIEPTRYVVTVTVVGQPSQTFTGSIEGPGDQGAAGAGVEVATFEVTGSP